MSGGKCKIWRCKCYVCNIRCVTYVLSGVRHKQHTVCYIRNIFVWFCGVSGEGKLPNRVGCYQGCYHGGL